MWFLLIFFFVCMCVCVLYISVVGGFAVDFVVKLLTFVDIAGGVVVIVVVEGIRNI